MKTVKFEKRVFEHGDVVELKGNDRPRHMIRKDEERIGINRFLIISVNARKDGQITAKALADDFNKVILKDEDLDKAEYVGKMDLSLLECL